MFIIQSGRVEIQTMRNNQTSTLGVLGPGSMFGEMALIDRAPRSATAVAEEKTTCLEISQMLFQKNLNAIPKWMRSFFSIIVERLRIANSKTTTVSEVDIRRQIVLLVNSALKGLSPDRLGEISCTWKLLVSDIALMLQVPEDTVDQVLHRIITAHLASSKLSDDGLRLFIVPDRDQFQEFANYCAARLRENHGKALPEEFSRQQAHHMELLRYIQIVMQDELWPQDIDLQILDLRFRELNQADLKDYDTELKTLKTEGVYDSRLQSDGSTVYSFHKEIITDLIRSQERLEAYEQVETAE